MTTLLAEHPLAEQSHPAHAQALDLPGELIDEVELLLARKRSTNCILTAALVWNGARFRFN